MAKILPFKALRPAPQFAKNVASRPYDVLSSKEAREEAAGSPESFLHITKSEIDLPAGTDVHAAAVYEKAKENLHAFVSRGILFQEDKPCYYLYELTMDGRTQTGLVCASSLSDYEHDVIRKHEFTRPEKEQDRINHISATGAQTGNVFLAYRNVPEIDALLGSWTSEKNPLYDITTDDGIRHRIWILNAEKTIDAITRLFAEQVPHTYIADGHHRAASAYQVSKQGRGTKWFLTTLFPANDLKILDYNRVVKDLNGFSAEELLQRLEQVATITPATEAVRPASAHEFGMYLGTEWYKLTLANAASSTADPVAGLAVSLFQQQILSPIFNIEDQRTDPRIDFVGGIRGTEELVKLVDAGEAKVAFTLYPVSMEELFAVADSGQVMPPKSTWFEPKLRDGLLTKLIDA